jgi:hypothetical protein
VRAFGKGVIINHRIEGVELYPKQDRLCGGPGSLVKLPFGIHNRCGHRYAFIYHDGSCLAPTVREHIEVLSAHKSVPEDVFEAYATYGWKSRKDVFPSQMARFTIQAKSRE